jgi:hypothetical protein
MPIAPPKTHWILPRRWGSGVNGARPRVNDTIKGVKKGSFLIILVF